MARVKKICKWCGHGMTFDKDKYIQQGRAEERERIIRELEKLSKSIVIRPSTFNKFDLIDKAIEIVRGEE